MSADPASSRVCVVHLGRVDCAETIERMRAFTASRDRSTPDEIWLCEHPPVYTLGIAARPAHLHRPGTIPVLQTDRGGQVTYHGPGQVVAYPLIDLARLGIFVKEYVYRLEQALIRTLEVHDVTGHRVAGAPGIYVRLADPFGHAPLDALDPAGRHAARHVEGAGAAAFAGLGKIAALGVKVSRHRTYHGLALNVAMDLAPFDGIDPCGHAGLRTADLSTIGVRVAPADVAATLATKLGAFLGA